MTWSVGQPLRVGDAVCVPLVESDVAVRAVGTRLSGHAHKRPCLVLVFRRGEVTGFDLAGHEVDAAEIERRYPGAIAEARNEKGPPPDER